MNQNRVATSADVDFIYLDRAPTGERVHANGKTVWKNTSCGRQRAALSLILISPAAAARVRPVYKPHSRFRPLDRAMKPAGRKSFDAVPGIAASRS